MLIDLIVVVFLLLSMYFGYKRGFVGTVSKLLCLVISIVAANFLHSYVSGFVRKTFIGDFINDSITSEAQSVTDGTNFIIKQAASGAVEELTDVAVTIATVVIIIIAVFIIANLVAKALNLVSKLPLVSLVNRICGIVAGLFMGLLTVYVVFLVIAVVNIDASWFDGSQLAVKIFEENIIMNLIF